MKRRPNLRLTFTVLMAGVVAGCASAPRKDADASGEKPVGSAGPAESLSSGAVLSQSRIDLVYLLGHNAHRFTAEAASENVKGSTYLDRQILKEGPIDSTRYVDLVQKVARFISSAQRQPASASSHCRHPFTVTLQVQQEKRIAHGCRSTTEGTAISRLAREAEFLLYSKK